MSPKTSRLTADDGDGDGDGNDDDDGDDDLVHKWKKS